MNYLRQQIANITIKDDRPLDIKISILNRQDVIKEQELKID